MGGYLEIWKGSRGDFDRLNRSCLPLARRAAKSLAKINVQFLEIFNQNETIAKYAAARANMPYGVGLENEDPSVVPTKTIIQTIDGPRALMSRADVNFYRSHLQSLIRSGNNNLAELDAITRTMRETLDRLEKISRFFRFTEKQEQDARRKALQGGGGGLKRARKSRRGRRKM
jgi:hypothetical protein